MNHFSANRCWAAKPQSPNSFQESINSRFRGNVYSTKFAPSRKSVEADRGGWKSRQYLQYAGFSPPMFPIPITSIPSFQLFLPLRGQEVQRGGGEVLPDLVEAESDVVDRGAGRSGHLRYR